jgi:FtsZ-binding cell division protein ZapB
MQHELNNFDEVKTELKQKRENLKKNYEAGMKQNEYLKQMEVLLQEKLRFKKEGRGDNGERGIERRTGQMDMLIMNHD